MDEKQNVNRCLIYNDSTGDVAFGGFFQLSALGRAARTNELKFEGSDGERVYLAGGKVLVPVKPIRPDAIPKGSVFANGLFISCDRPEAANTECSVYRPDGGPYFKGIFTFQGEPGTELRNRAYKFFDLSTRTIFLEGSGTLVSK